MEIDDVRLHLERSSRRAGLLTMVGVLFVVGALVFSFYYLNRKINEVKQLDDQIAAKQALETDLDNRVKEKQKLLDDTEKAFADYQSKIKESAPQLAVEAIMETIEKNPGASQVILNGTSKNAASAPSPPPGARVGFCITDNVTVRAKPELDAAEIGRLDRGDTFFVTEYSTNITEWKGKRGPWAHIQTEKGEPGWVFSPFVAIAKKKELEVVKN
jgi:hypothetical protein